MSEGSVIGKGTVVRGQLRGEGSLEILGHVEGDVTVSGNLRLAEGSSVRGNVTGSEVSVAGVVQGDLRGSDVLLLEAGARVVGDVFAPRIGIASGALVRGHIRTDGEAQLGGAGRRGVASAQPGRPAQFSRSAATRPEPARNAAGQQPRPEAQRPVASVQRAEAPRSVPLRPAERASGPARSELLKVVAPPERPEIPGRSVVVPLKPEASKQASRADFADEDEMGDEPSKPREEKAAPPPPIVPSLSKGTKAKQKKKTRSS